MAMAISFRAFFWFPAGAAKPDQCTRRVISMTCSTIASAIISTTPPTNIIITGSSSATSRACYFHAALRPQKLIEAIDSQRMPIVMRSKNCTARGAPAVAARRRLATNPSGLFLAIIVNSEYLFPLYATVAVFLAPLPIE